MHCIKFLCLVSRPLQDNWHGKPVPEQVIEAIEERIMNKENIAGTLHVNPPVSDAPNVQLPIGHIKMAPPEYKIGDKVFSSAIFGA